VLRIEDRDRVRLLTLSRPDVLNAMDTNLWRALGDALSGAAESPHVRAAVITGDGRAFCAGQDLAEMSRLGGDGTGPARNETHGFAGCLDALMAFDKPLLAAVNGLGVGFGVTVLGHCDIVLIADDARLRVPFVNLGVVPEAGSSFTLPDIMGWQAAAEVLFTGRWMSADEAVTHGLALRKCRPELVVDETMKLAAQIAVHGLDSLVGTKRLMKASRTALVADARRREEAEFAKLTGAPANRAALDAFLTKG
jgi:enoyl-CoA hydratase/carnithine racemase